MKTLLRSLILVNPSDRKDDLLDNFRAIQQSQLIVGPHGPRFSVVQDLVLWNHIRDFVRVYNHVPDLLSIRHHFDLIKEDTVVKRLAHISSVQCLTRGDFRARIVDLERDALTRDVGEALKLAAEILVSGVDVKDGRETIKYRGGLDALNYLQEVQRKVQSRVRLTHRGVLDPTFLADDYERRRDSRSTLLHSGLEEIDLALQGVRPGQLWVHAGFTGGMKSTFLLNWIHHLAYGVPAVVLAENAVPNRRRILFYSLEMGFRDPQYMLVAMHSGAFWAREKRIELGLPDATYSGLPYEHLQDGTLHDWHPQGEAYLRYVLDALRQRQPNYGQVEIIAPDPNKGPITMQEIWDQAEAWEQDPRHGPVDMIVIDHMGLVGPPKGAGPAQFERLQAIYQEAHRMALGFARGRGVAVVCAHQINREGGTKVIATSEKGGKVPRFDLTHLAGSSEAERSADIVTTSYVDDRCRGKGLVLFDCLKSRHRRLFEPFLAYVDWPTRRLRSQLDLPDRTPIVPRSLFAGGSNQEPAVSNVGLQDINYGLDD